VTERGASNFSDCVPIRDASGLQRGGIPFKLRRRGDPKQEGGGLRSRKNQKREKLLNSVNMRTVLTLILAERILGDTK